MESKWQHQVPGIRSLVTDCDGTDEGAVEVIKAIHQKVAPMGIFADLMVLDEFEEFDGNLSEADYLIEALYDYADENLIWIE